MSRGLGTAAGSALTDWERILAPRSVALVGASSRQGHPMARPLTWLRDRGFTGRVIPVNPKHTELGGLPCYPDLASVPGQLDLVLSLVPADRAVTIVEEAGAVGAAAVIVFASGFAETGPEGVTLQAELAAAALRTGVRVLGPNCQGIYLARSGLFATFTAAGERPSWAAAASPTWVRAAPSAEPSSMSPPLAGWTSPPGSAQATRQTST